MKICWYHTYEQDNFVSEFHHESLFKAIHVRLSECFKNYTCIMSLSQIRTTQKHSHVNVCDSHQAEIADCWYNNKFTLIVDETPELVFFIPPTVY